MADKYGDIVAEYIGQLTDAQVLAIVGTSGLASHQYFKTYEPSLGSAFKFALSASVLFISALVTLTSRSNLAVASLYGKSALVYLSTLFGSIGVYRVFFHPLRNIPGDRFASITKWWAMTSSFQGQLGYDAYKMHLKYGPVVRLGPNWVDFQSAATIPKIYGANPAQLRKDDFGLGPDYDALQHIKDDARHARRRKIWDQGFSTKALSEYETDIKTCINQLVDGVAKASNASADHEVDIELWSSFFSFDVMGYLGFGEGFKMLENGRHHRFFELLKASMQIAPPFSQVSWIVPLKLILPTHPDEKEFMQFTSDQVTKRILQGSKRRDLYAWLLGEEGDHSERMTQVQLNSDSILTVVAGSDTTSSVLTWAWYYMLKTRDGHYYKLLQKELDADAEEGSVDTARLARLPLLNAVINETMRLQPPVPGGLQRLAPKGGIVLDGVYVPAGTTVTTGAYVVQRDPANWSPAPDEFRPERWIDSDKEIAANKNAFIPFSYGPRSCPGKQLAYMEARLVLAALVPRYDAKLKPGFDCATFEAGVRDCFTIQSPALPILLNPRETKNVF